MMRGLWTLTWLETKIFLREPMGAIGTVAVPLGVFVAAGRVGGRRLQGASIAFSSFLRVALPVLAAVLVAIGADCR
jgi:ABC-2 type transport system permease protein